MTDQIKYVGPADIHDAVIMSVSDEVNNFIVKLRTYDEKIIIIKFKGVKEIRSNEAKGMILYALTESGESPAKHYVFSNWDEDNTASLEVIAEGFELGYE